MRNSWLCNQFQKVTQADPFRKFKFFHLTPTDRSISKEIRKVSVFWKKKKIEDSKVTNYLA